MIECRSGARVASSMRPGMTGQQQAPMTPTEIENTFRDEAGRALATLIRLVGDFDLAQDALQDAFAVAVERLPSAQLPAHAPAWAVHIGPHQAVDRRTRTLPLR